MQVMFWADVTHDDPKQTLVIVDAYPVGTKALIGLVGKFAIPPGTLVHERVAAFVLPIVAEPGKPWTGEIRVG